jgi:SecD/SecF fusion protein
MAPYLVPLAIFAGIMLVAYLAGNYVTKSLRLPDHGWKVTLIVASIGLAVWILVVKWPPKQGIDLKGGVILIYEVDEQLTRQSARRQQDGRADQPAPTDEQLGKVDMPGLIQALTRRINPGGVQEIVVRPYGDKQVEVIIPDVTGPEVDEIKKLITTGGFLKFQIVANRRDHSHIWSLADEPGQVGQYEVKDANGNVVGQWVKLQNNPQAKEGESPYRADPPQAKSRMVRNRKEVLMVVDPNFDLQGSDLASVRKGYQGVSPAVFFDTTPGGARVMGALTASNLPDTASGHYSLLGIVMDGELISAPRINSTITSSGVIEGSFTDAEVDLLVGVLRAGRLPAVLRQEPISQNEISPLLGSDTIKQGKVSIVVSLAAVAGFLIVYYRFAGIVACLSLCLNLVLILALMMFVGAAFSLPGMAALVLTVGMSDDANVLIYERIREELRNGASIRMALRTGYQRATTTIVDSNLTTLITAFVLYAIGTEQLRAFAVALILGILMTLFAGVFCSRVFFEIMERTGNLKKFTMMQMFSDTNWDLFHKRKYAFVLSGVLIVLGMGAAITRGSRIFDIDFTGGTSVQLLLKEQMPLADVRRRVDNLKAKGIAQDVSVTEVKSDLLGPGVIYRIDTSLPQLDASTASSAQVVSAIGEVQNALMDEFRDGEELLLKTRAMSFTPPSAIGAAIAPTSPGLPEVEGPAASDPLGATDESANQDAAGDVPAENQGTMVPSSVDGFSLAGIGGDELLAYAGQYLLAQVDSAAGSPVGSVPSTSAATSSSSGADDSSLRSESSMQFEEAINAETLEGLFKDTAKSLGIVQPDVQLVSDELNWIEGSSQGHKSWRVRLSTTPAQAEQILSVLKTKLDGTPVWLAANQIGSSVAGDKTRLALAAITGSLIGIIAYVWFRFERLSYGVAAVVALIHDVLITIGAIAATYWLKDVFGFLMIDEFKISLPVTAALLTIIGYSINDTIVVFDRIRELKGKSPNLSAQLINDSINQTLSRTVLTSATTFLAVLVLYVLGGPGIHAFAFALMVGIFVGTYSSIFVASPLLLWNVKAGEATVTNKERVSA